MKHFKEMTAAQSNKRQEFLSAVAHSTEIKS